MVKSKKYFAFSEKQLKNFKIKSRFFLVLSIFLLLGILVLSVTKSFNLICMLASLFLILSTTEFFFFEKFANGSVFYRIENDKVLFVNKGYDLDNEIVIKDISSNKIKSMCLALALPISLVSIFIGRFLGKVFARYWLIIISIVASIGVIYLVVDSYFRANKKIVEGVVKKD